MIFSYKPLINVFSQTSVLIYFAKTPINKALNINQGTYQSKDKFDTYKPTYVLLSGPNPEALRY